MSKVTVDISISLDGFVAGPDPTLEEPLGKGGERLHDWWYAGSSLRQRITRIRTPDADWE